MDSSFDLLVERGFVYQSSDDDGLRTALREPLTLYCGYDSTAASLHVGSLVPIMAMAHLQRAGHRIIGLVGGGTTMIPDPTGKTEMRPLLSPGQINENLQSIKTQLGRYIEFEAGRGIMVNNADWLLDLKYIPFLRDIGIHFSVNQLMQHETYRERFQGSGLSFIELNYALLQAYDFLHLYREYGCRLQIGGSDQWFNILAGVDLIRRVEQVQAFALVCPLLTTTSGTKMGKTEKGAVWLDPELNKPYDFYQFWMNTEDPDVGRFLRLFTFLPDDEIRKLEALEGAELRAAKEVLAYEATRLTHGQAAADEARAASRALFSDAGAGALDAVPTTTIPVAELAAGLELADLLVRSGLAGSKREAHRLIGQGGIYVGDRRVEGPDLRVTAEDVRDGGLLLRAGKKRYRRVVAET